MKKISILLGFALVIMTTTMGAKKLTDNSVSLDLTNCAYDDTYTLNLAQGGPTQESCTHGQINTFDIGSDQLLSITIYGTTIPNGDTATVSRGPAGGHHLIGAPDNPIAPVADTITVRSF